jgi:hypothetical protein
MPVTAPDDFAQTTFGKRLEERFAARREAWVAEQEAGREAEHLAATMRLFKAARFNAAERLERKATVSLFTQSTVALYFVGLAM